MESLTEKYSVCTKTELVNIINGLIEEFGSNANEYVNKKIEELKCKKNNKIASVTTITSASNTDVSNISQSSNLQSGQKKEKRAFDMSQYRQRHIALQLQYEGEPYFGFASQAGESEETVEKHLFAALMKVKLITDRASCNYTRCGRTDSGVSAFGQIVALNLRSAFPKDLEKLPEHPSDSIRWKRNVEVTLSAKANPHLGPGKHVELQEREETISELDYVGIINRNLPDSIRVIAWKEVTPQFSARFSCSGRTYRYFFTRKRVHEDKNNKVLDIDRMNKAASYLVGEHDFRNFCKMDVAHVSNFRRTIYSAEVTLFSTLSSNEAPEVDSTQDIYMLEITGLAFLWHMVRCIMSVLFLVGYGREEPEIVQQLLNLQLVPPLGFATGKPHYSMAPELPLVLHKCHFDHMNMNLHMPKVLWALSVHYNMLIEHHMLAAMRAKNAFDQVLSYKVRSCDVYDDFLPHIKKLYSTGNAKANDGVKELKGKKYESICSIGAEPTSINAEDSRMDDKISSVSDEEVKLVEIPFRDVIHILLNEHHISPATRHSNSYIPKADGYIKLHYRDKQDSYEEQCKKVTGNKQDRMKRHLNMTQKALEINPAFHSAMRSQGGVADIGSGIHHHN